MQGTVGTSDISLAATTTPSKPQPGGGRAAPPPVGGSPTVTSTPGGRTRSVRRPFGPFQFVRPFELLRCCSCYCSCRGSKLLPAAAEVHDTAKASFRPRRGAPSSPCSSAACLPSGAHTRPSRRALCQAWHAPVTSVPSLALRCSRSQAHPAVRKIFVGAENVPPVPPRPAQVSTPTHPCLNPTGGRSGGRVCVWVCQQDPQARARQMQGDHDAALQLARREEEARQRRVEDDERASLAPVAPIRREEGVHSHGNSEGFSCDSYGSDASSSMVSEQWVFCLRGFHAHTQTATRTLTFRPAHTRARAHTHLYAKTHTNARRSKRKRTTAR